MAEKIIGLQIKVLGSDAQVKELGGIDNALRKLADSRRDLIKAEKEAQANLKNVAADRKEIIALEESGALTKKEAAKQIRELTELEVLSNDVIRNSSKAIGENIIETQKLRSERSAVQDSIKQQVNLELSNQNTIEGMRAKVSLLTAEWKKADIGSEKFKQLQGELSKTTEELKKQEAAVGDNRRNVGNYTSVLSGLGAILKNSGGAFGAAATGVSGFNTALKANPILAVISVLLPLILSMTKLQPVTDAVKVAMGALNNVMDVLISRAGKLVEGFSFLIKGEFRNAAESAAGAFDNLGSSLVNAATSGAEFAKVQKQIDDATQRQAVATADAEKQIAVLTQRLKDRTLTEQQRLTIADEISRIEGDNFKASKKNLDEQLKLEQDRVRQLLINKGISEDQLQTTEQLIKAGQDRAIEDEILDKLTASQVNLTNAEKESLSITERVSVRRNAILEDEQDKKDKAAKKEADRIAALSDLEQKFSQSEVDRINKEFEENLLKIEGFGRRENKLRFDVLVANQKALDELQLKSNQAGLEKELLFLDASAKQKLDKELQLIENEKQQKLLAVEKGSEQEKLILAQAEKAKSDLVFDFSQKRIEQQEIVRNRELESFIRQSQLITSKAEESYNAQLIGEFEFNRIKLEERKRVADKTLEFLTEEFEQVQKLLSSDLTASVGVDGLIPDDIKNEIANLLKGAEGEGINLKDNILSDDEKELLKVNLDEIILKLQEVKTEKAAIGQDEEQNKQTLADVLGINEEGLEKFNTNISAIGGAIAGLGQAIAQRDAQKIAQIDKEKQTEIAAIDAKIKKAKEEGKNTEALERQKDKIQSEFDAKRAKEEENANRTKKKFALIQAIINTALAITSALTFTPPASFVLAALAAATGAIQIATIAKSKKGGFLKGKKGFITKGHSHAEKGVLLYDTKSGQFTGQEIEGGEPVLTKNVSRNPELLQRASDINVEAGGIPLTRRLARRGTLLQTGGVTARQSQVSAVDTAISRLDDRFEERISSLRVVNVATETDGVSTGVKNLASEFSFGS